MSPVNIGSVYYNLKEGKVKVWDGTAWVDFQGPKGEKGEKGPPGEVVNQSNGQKVYIGTGPDQIVALDGSSRLPAVDGSQLTRLPGQKSVGAVYDGRALDQNDDGAAFLVTLANPVIQLPDPKQIIGDWQIYLHLSGQPSSFQQFQLKSAGGPSIAFRTHGYTVTSPLYLIGDAEHLLISRYNNIGWAIQLLQRPPKRFSANDSTTGSTAGWKSESQWTSIALPNTSYNPVKLGQSDASFVKHKIGRSGFYNFEAHARFKRTSTSPAHWGVRLQANGGTIAIKNSNIITADKGFTINARLDQQVYLNQGAEIELQAITTGAAEIHRYGGTTALHINLLGA